MTLSKFTQIKDSKSSNISSWVLPKIEDDTDFNTNITLDDEFSAIDFSKNISEFNTKTSLKEGITISQEYVSEREKGYGEGYEIGKHEAENLFKEELKAHTDALTEILDGIQKPYSSLQNRIHKEIAELAILIAEKMILDHIEKTPESLINIVAEAVKLLPANNLAIELYFNQDDYNFMQSHLDILEGYKYKIDVDHTLQRGSVKITSDNTDIDLSLDKRIHDLVDQFLKNGN